MNYPPKRLALLFMLPAPLPVQNDPSTCARLTGGDDYGNHEPR